MAVTLYRFSDAWGFDPSLYCMKVQTYLRLANIDYLDRVGVDNVGKSPRKQLPFIDDHGTVVAARGMIIKHLKGKYGDNLDKDLSDEQRALGHAVARMLEDGSYQIGLRDRWCGSDQVWEAYEPVLFEGLPKSLRPVVPKLVRRDYRKRLRGQGLGRRPDAEIKALGEADVRSVAALIGGKAFLLGDKDASYDATVFAFMGNAYYAPFDTPLKGAISKHQNLVGYLDRVSRLVRLPERTSAPSPQQPVSAQATAAGS